MQGQKTARCIGALFAAVAFGTSWAQAPGASTKGIFVDNSKPGVKVEIIVYDSGTPRVVGADHPFKNRDRFRLRFELNRSGYVYLFNRSLTGDPDALRSKGITVIEAEDAKAARTGNGSYRLVYPTGAAVVRVAAHQAEEVPIDGSYLAMDDQPGVEKLLLMVSHEPMDFAAEFDLISGAPKGLEVPDERGRKQDSAERVLSRLRARQAQPGGRREPPPRPAAGLPINRALVQAWNNTRMERHVTIPTKGIEEVEDAVYAVQGDESRPMLVEVTLLHYAR